MSGTSIDSLDGEYQTLTEACGLLDRSERGKLALSGAGAVEFLNGQVTNELATLRAGEGRYAAFLTPKGKMLGDLRILAVGSDRQAPPSELLLDTERVALQALFDMIRRYRVGYDVQLHKHTLERGLISLVGPESAVVAGAVVPGDAGDGSRVEPADDEHANAPVEIDGIACLAVRTDTGVDLICEATATERLLQALRGRGASPVSEQATECLRVERGRPRYGIDLDDTVIPQEAGLNERAVSFTKGCYVGQETVARLFYRGKPNRHLRGLRLSRAAERGEPLTLGERVLGRVSSSVSSPRLGPIALALLRREAEPGAVVSVGAHGAEAEIVRLPFSGAL